MQCCRSRLCLCVHLCGHGEHERTEQHAMCERATPGWIGFLPPASIALQSIYATNPPTRVVHPFRALHVCVWGCVWGWWGWGVVSLCYWESQGEGAWSRYCATAIKTPSQVRRSVGRRHWQICRSAGIATIGPITGGLYEEGVTATHLRRMRSLMFHTRQPQEPQKVLPRTNWNSHSHLPL